MPHGSDRNARGELASDTLVKCCWILLAVLAVCTTVKAGPLSIFQPLSRQQKVSSSSSTAAPESKADKIPQIVAMVNGQEITKDQLAKECLIHYGEQVLENVVNKLLIEQECQRRGITVTEQEINAEIERIAKTFGISVEQLLQMLEQERGIKPDQYASEIIWPMLALRKLAGQELEVTEEELRRQYESLYGPAVKVRMIVCDSRQAAEQIRAEAIKNPERFGELARKYSTDTASAAMDGLIQPVRKHRGPEQLQQMAFSIKDGEISPVFQIANRYVIIKREALLPPANIPFEQVKMRLIEMVREEKMREVGTRIFRRLQESSQIVNVLNDPQRRQQIPGVAAIVNGQQITIARLAEECLKRHGEEVLEGLINRTLLEQACRKKGITITDADIEKEIARAAATMLPPKADGSPDVERWIQLYCSENNISEEVYRRDIVWPTVALKKLVGDRVQVTEEDLRKGYEANYGPRVRCLAIVLNDLRRAQKVWAMARANPTREFFAELAAKYSTDPQTRALRGEIPPIQKHGGQPTLEKEAFSLKPGEISGIIDVGGGYYVILYCEGQTQPVAVDFESVRQLIYDDIYEKKLRVEMAQYFDQLKENAVIDNYLAGTSHSPLPRQPAAEHIPAQAIRPVNIR